MNVPVEIRDLGVIGDRRTAALVDRRGGIVWYCPGRFDAPSLLAALLDRERGGAWSLTSPAFEPHSRAYKGDSAVLETRLSHQGAESTVTDWMPMGEDCPQGICRVLSPSAADVTATLVPAPNYGSRTAAIELDAGRACIDGRIWLYASSEPRIERGAVVVDIPAGEHGWLALLDRECGQLSIEDLRRWQASTLREWRDIAHRITYHGPLEGQVAASLRALRLMTHAPTGGIVAAATTSLPEIEGGNRNYDYRYVWMRDTGMIVSALVRAGSTGPDERRFLEFLCKAAQRSNVPILLPPFLSIDTAPAPDRRAIELSGFRDSRPVYVGNGANTQLQLDGLSNVLFAAKLIYGRHDTREHWDTVVRIADFLAEHWREPDYGIWEEHERRQYTTGKVTASCGLRYIAKFCDDADRARRWCEAADGIDRYVRENCMTREGAYAAFAGTDAVDVSAALFAAWGYVDADCPAMQATMRVLERDYCRDNLYWRHLEELGPFKEGAFVAGTLWVAQYWILRGDLDRGRAILDAALAYANDLGFFAEEADPASGRMLGNFPQTFVHASMVGAAIDLRDAERGST
jgi:GH15 family glucan-1,4-alpha-glucosidase